MSNANFRSIASIVFGFSICFVWILIVGFFVKNANVGGGVGAGVLALIVLAISLPILFYFSKTIMYRFLKSDNINLDQGVEKAEEEKSTKFGFIILIAIIALFAFSIILLNQLGYF